MLRGDVDGPSHFANLSHRSLLNYPPRAGIPEQSL